MIYDAHIHHKNNETGGFLIGLEGKPHFEETLSNTQVMELHNPEEGYFSFYYVVNDEIDKKINHKYLKYHPRREKYNYKNVISSIRINMPRAVIIDTLNEPDWTAYDYWRIAREFPEIPFVMAHAGGYLINEFIKICHFQKNVWLDFALTHTVLGGLGDENIGLPYINQAIKYALNASFRDRILLSSDYPFFSQDDVFKYYDSYIDMLNDNYLKLVRRI